MPIVSIFPTGSGGSGGGGGGWLVSLGVPCSGGGFWLCFFLHPPAPRTKREIVFGFLFLKKKKKYVSRSFIVT